MSFLQSSLSWLASSVQKGTTLAAFGTYLFVGTVYVDQNTFGAEENPKHFREPTAVPVYGANNYIPTFGNAPGNVYGIESMGTPDVTATHNLWTVGAPLTTRQEWTSLWHRRVGTTQNTPEIRMVYTDIFAHDGSTSMSTPLLTVRGPGYVTGSGNLYSFSGDYGASLSVANYGGASSSLTGGTMVLFQTSGGINPDIEPLYNIGAPTGDSYDTGYHPENIKFTTSNDIVLNAEILEFGINFAQLNVDSSFGAVPWQELYWAAWLPDWTGDFKIDMGIPVHAAFSSTRIDTSIGMMIGDASLGNFSAVPEPSSMALLLLSVAGAAGYRLKRKGAKQTDAP